MWHRIWAMGDGRCVGQLVELGQFMVVFELKGFGDQLAKKNSEEKLHWKVNVVSPVVWGLPIMIWLISLIPFPRISNLRLIASGTTYAIDHTLQVTHRSAATNLQMSLQSPELLKLESVNLSPFSLVATEKYNNQGIVQGPWESSQVREAANPSLYECLCVILKATLIKWF